jgi:hypothetical protein
VYRKSLFLRGSYNDQERPEGEQRAAETGQITGEPGQLPVNDVYNIKQERLDFAQESLDSEQGKLYRAGQAVQRTDEAVGVQCTKEQKWLDI